VRIFTGPDDLVASVGLVLGTSDWFAVDQERVNLFAEATEDRQWIHVDPASAQKGPYGATIAHGYLTLSLVPYLSKQAYRVEGAVMALNYGLDRVRFPSPLRVGDSIRSVVKLLAAVEPAGTYGEVQAHLENTIEVHGIDRPVCVAETIVRYRF
jgi:acyl dehydratase